MSCEHREVQAIITVDTKTRAETVEWQCCRCLGRWPNGAAIPGHAALLYLRPLPLKA